VLGNTGLALGNGTQLCRIPTKAVFFPQTLQSMKTPFCGVQGGTLPTPL
jgi:hypothetical protein